MSLVKWYLLIGAGAAVFKQVIRPWMAAPPGVPLPPIDPGSLIGATLTWPIGACGLIAPCNCPVPPPSSLQGW